MHFPDVDYSLGLPYLTRLSRYAANDQQKYMRIRVAGLQGGHTSKLNLFSLTVDLMPYSQADSKRMSHCGHGRGQLRQGYLPGHSWNQACAAKHESSITHVVVC